MADIELVIKIPEELFSEIDDENYQSKISWYDTTLYCAIKNGAPLPKGHGRLIDGELLDRRLNFVLNHTGGYKKTPIGTGIVIAMAENLDAPTIIEADKEEKE